MLRMFTPDIYAENIHKIDLDELCNRGIKGVILDIDNTLESHKVPKATKETLKFLENLEDKGFKICLISNGRHERVKIFNEDLGYFAMAKAGKPKKCGYRRAMAEMGLSASEVAMIGDQLFTDVFGAKRCKMTSVLVEPIESIENGFFYIKRFFEKRIKENIVK